MNSMYRVPLSKLYKVLGSCQYNEEGEFCPVLLEIKDESIIAKNNGLPYLVQVWDRKGQMAYERSFEKPIECWNISDNYFVYQEDRKHTVVHLIELFTDKQPFVHKFTLNTDAHLEGVRP